MKLSNIASIKGIKEAEKIVLLINREDFQHHIKHPVFTKVGLVSLKKRDYYTCTWEGIKTCFIILDVTLTKEITATWMGKEGITYDVLFNTNTNGKRISFRYLFDDHIAELKAIEGDGRKEGFRVFEKVTLDEPSPLQIEQKINELIINNFIKPQLN